MVQCTRFGKMKKSKFKLNEHVKASKEQECLECGKGKIYANGNRIIKIERFDHGDDVIEIERDYD